MINIIILPFLLLIWMYLGYPILLFILSKIRPNMIIKKSIEPYITVIVCTFNESAVIDRRIKNLYDQEYPKEKMEIIIVDSSTDNTRNIIKDKWMDKVILIEEKKRSGKPKALNLGFGKSSNEIIILSDAPASFDSYAIKNIVRNFADPHVGAVTGKYKPIGGETIFWKFKNILRSLEGNVDSTTFLSGDLLAFRKELLEKVDEDSLADDVNIAIKIREKGYRTIYDNSSIVIEKVTNTSKDFITQKTRRAIGGIQETMRFKWMIFNLKLGLFGMFIMPTRFLFTVLNPFIFLSCLICITYILININFYLILSLSILFSLFIVFKKSNIVRTLINFSMTIYIQFLAVLKYLQKDLNVKWKKVKIPQLFNYP